MNELVSGGISQAIGSVFDLGTSAVNRGANYRRSKKLMKEQMKNEKEMSEHYYDMSMRKWEDTGYEAQMEQMKKAGLNAGLMYGTSGAGGQTSAVDKSPQVAGAVGGQGSSMNNMLMGNQAKLLEAQTKKTEAETANISGGTAENLTEDARGKKFQNDINEKYRDLIEEAKTMEWDVTKIKGEEANAAWEFKKAIDYGVKPEQDGPFTNKDSRAGRARIAELAVYEEDLKKAKTENNIAEAEEVIKDFEASMARQGISPNSPWYAKLITDLLNKVGLLDLIGAGQKAVKNEVKQIGK